jgi:sulfite reductase alpha subunit-like flavoprotein
LRSPGQASALSFTFEAQVASGRTTAVELGSSEPVSVAITHVSQRCSLHAQESEKVVWVIFASKYGSTREVAEAVADEIGRDHDVTVHDAADIDAFDGADAVVLGSAIYGGRWLAGVWSA